ncbi:hypothetical protein [Rubrivirga sp.]|uniref:hypothetical protein n=1 Tax=Rubrivirga sp. TaxID=1885344 RepID=UPI003C71E21F
MKPLFAFVLAIAFVAGCADEPAAPADPPIAPGAAEVVTDPEEDAMTDTLMLDDDVMIDDADLEVGEVEDVDEGL